ncbi:MAG: ThiF family adenylyltransferase [Pirellulaceae bacterium]
MTTEKTSQEAVRPTDSRYSRQIRFDSIGNLGQERIRAARILILGVGALGSAVAEILARAGVGNLRLVDRDFVDLSNLQRQSLFDEIDAKAGTPKVIAAKEHLARINSEVVVEAIIEDATPRTIERIVGGVDLVIDGTDNFETRFLINDICVRDRKPWIFGGCLGAEGQVAAIAPGKTPCLRCWMPAGPPESHGTCDTVGVLGPIVQVIAAVEAAEAMKIVVGGPDQAFSGIQAFSLWEVSHRTIGTGEKGRNENCACCGKLQFNWLNASQFGEAVSLCGRNSVQLTPGTPKNLDLEHVAESIGQTSLIQCTRHLLRIQVEQFRITCFRDGRAIVEGTNDLGIARSLYSRFFG